MRYLLSTILLLAWALWLGGLCMLFMAIGAIFGSSRDLGIQVGPILFPAFERYALVVAAAALVAIVGLYILNRSRFGAVVFILFAVGALTTVASKVWITPKMVALWAVGGSGSPEFSRLHGQSMMVYSAGLLAVALAGLMLPKVVQTTRTSYAVDASKPWKEDQKM